MNSRHAWRRLGQPRFGLADRISDAISAHEWSEPGVLSDVRAGKEVLLACDIGGDHREAAYRAFGYLVAEIGSSRDWMEQRLALRQAKLPDGRRMSYKALRDSIRKEALASFLRTASSLQGNLVIFLVSREIPTLFSDPGDLRLLPELVVAERGWNQSAFARLLAVGTFGTLLLAGLADPGQDILWLTDQDEIAPNATKHNHAGHVICHCIERYAPNHRGQLVFLTTEGAFDHCFREDLVAIPDLAAGALVETFSRSPVGGSAPISAYGADRSLSQKAQVVLQWLSSSGPRLHTIVAVLRPNGAQVDVTVFTPRWYGGQLLCLNGRTG